MPFTPRPWNDDWIVCADISPCEHYRYSLRITWGSGDLVVVVGLNPSTADKKLDDKTARQCVKWARAEENCGGLLLLNAYAFRAKLPSDMKAADDPFGGQTPEKIIEMCGQNRIIVAWGNEAEYRGRGDALAAAFAKALVRLECWDVNVNGSPRHPGRIGIGKTEPWPRKNKTTS